MRALQLTRERVAVHPLIEQAARCYAAYHEYRHVPEDAAAAALFMFPAVADRDAFCRRVAVIYAEGVRS